jgi:uncharacterized protein (TIGR00730 family)
MKERKKDERIRKLVAEVATGRNAEVVAEMIETALRFGRDKTGFGDLKLYNRAMRELRYAANIFSRYQGHRKVAVFGSARTKPDAEEYRLARDFAARMVAEGYMIITGGGDGIMGAAQEGAGAEHSFGLNIRLPFEQRANETIDGDPKLINFRYFFTRKLNFVKETHAFALLPGGFGTHDEGFEVLTLLQTGKSPIVPIVLLDRPNGHYWETWRRFLVNDLLEQGLISKADLNLFFITHDVETAARHISAFYRNFHSYRWVREKLVVRVQRPLTDEGLAKLNEEFSGMLISGRIEQVPPLPEEAEDTHLAHMSRITLVPKKDFGSLRLFLDSLNSIFEDSLQESLGGG